MSDIWRYGPASRFSWGTDLTGYKVEATDGHVGRVDDATEEVGGAFIVVDCNPWLIGKHVMLPAGTITVFDADQETIHVNRTKDEIKNAPEYDPELHRDDTKYRYTVGTYYGSHNR